MRNIRSARYLAAVAVAGGGLMVTAAPAFADAGQNGHNCEGAVVSSQTPQVVSQPPGAFGDFVSGQGQSGTRDDFVAVYNALNVNCGSHP
jgi:hypothetical protein